jgi:hypothetical protein
MLPGCGLFELTVLIASAVKQRTGLALVDC